MRIGTMTPPLNIDARRKMAGSRGDVWTKEQAMNDSSTMLEETHQGYL
jgi:hypothetical protein